MAKEIIIDGVDVSGCGFLHPEYSDKDCHIALAFTDEYEECTKCEQNPNCYYKQLKHKEQENEKLKDKLNDCISEGEAIAICYEGEKAINDKYKQTLDEIEKVINKNCDSCNGDCEYPCDLHKILSIIKQAKGEE